MSRSRLWWAATPSLKSIRSVTSSQLKDLKACVHREHSLAHVRVCISVSICAQEASEQTKRNADTHRCHIDYNAASTWSSATNSEPK